MGSRKKKYSQRPVTFSDRFVRVKSFGAYRSKTQGIPDVIGEEVTEAEAPLVMSESEGISSDAGRSHLGGRFFKSRGASSTGGGGDPKRMLFCLEKEKDEKKTGGVTMDLSRVAGKISGSTYWDKFKVGKTETDKTNCIS